MIDAAALLADTRKRATALVDDLRSNADRPTVEAEYQRAVAAGRTSLPLPQWAEGVYAQVAVSWVLGCVFVRFCEDNGLVSDALLCGPGNRRDLARDQRADYLRRFPAHDDRHWLRHVFTTYAALPATGDIFGAHNPLWLLEPSADGARELLGEFQRINAATGELAHDFTDPSWNTRFLGDLYQDLSDHAKKQYALLQTPEFVEEFILDYTLEPAIKTFGLRDTDLIDPTCGSGHFLLGAFHRLFEKWVDTEPGTNRRELARRALDAVAGVDINPFAVAIARFRLMVAALKAGGDRRLADAPTYPVNVAVGDSLLHTVTQLTLAGIGEDDDVAAAAAHGYSTEDLEAARALLSRQWAAVVGNPPYIVVRDPALNALYRKKYATCHRQYSLGVPFTERFWQLARGGDVDRERAGYIGMITTNGFMKREYGSKLIERWLPNHDLTHVIDTSGASIPGHGTPTVTLFGRGRRPVLPTVRAVMGIRGEPDTPADPSIGLVWTSILATLERPGSSTAFVSSTDLERTRLHRHPWSIGGGGASELKVRIGKSCAVELKDLIETICTLFITREDDVYFAPRGTWARAGIGSQLVRKVGYGTAVRDFRLESRVETIYPYDETYAPTLGEKDQLLTALWPHKQSLSRRKELGGTQVEVGRTWFEWNRFLTHRMKGQLCIPFAFVATHNHFVLDRGGNVYNRSAPVIKLRPDAGIDAHLDLLGVLNSSTAGFWMRQVFHDKGNRGEGGGITAEAWERFHEYDATKLQTFPLPSQMPRDTAAAIDRAATRLSESSPVALCSRDLPAASAIAASREDWSETLCKMIGLQERLDWETYRLYGLINEDMSALPDPPLSLGERAFEIVLARRVAAGEEETTWFVRHGSTPITEPPAHWSPEYRALVERRIEIIESNLEIALIERPEYKRRWNTTPWEEQQQSALKGWLLDRLELPSYWASPTITSTARLAALARADDDFMTVARIYAGRDDVDVATLVADLVKGESVPYLAALRYTDSGMRKRAQWCETWVLQRREDAGEEVGEIPVPPRYANADFTGTAWAHRGKLDVPKERFISYPGASSDTDPSLVIGWAGWNHLERARALAGFYLLAKRDGRDASVLTPLLAGLAELVPWLKQWYDEPNADPALDRPGTQIAGLLDVELRALHFTPDQLDRWRPAPTARGRKKKS
jgi:hypothetical protein